MTEPPVALMARFWVALICALKILSDGVFARRVLLLSGGATTPRLAAPGDLESTSAPTPKEERPAPAANDDPALVLLALFQREGRLVDFLQQDVESFPDADIGAAARVVHAGCRRALRAHLELERVRSEVEGSRITVPAGFDASAVKLSGDVRGTAPYQGVLRHSGWRARSVRLPQHVPGHDASILAPAEVEL